MENPARDAVREVHPITEQNIPRILIIDDDESICRLITRSLDTKGYGCTIANDAANARNEMKDHTFDLILCDVKMHGGSGIEVLQSIKKERPDIKVIMFTNYPYPQYRKKCMDLGADFFFAKATESDQIPVAVMGLIQESHD